MARALLSDISLGKPSVDEQSGFSLLFIGQTRPLEGHGIGYGEVICKRSTADSLYSWLISQVTDSTNFTFPAICFQGEHTHDRSHPY